MTVSELQALGQNGATVMNVGKHAGKREIRGAIRYRPGDLLTAEQLMLPISPDLPVVLYDEHGADDHTRQIAEKLRAASHRVEILEGGFAAWSDAGGETQEPSIEQTVPPARSDEVGKLDNRV